MVVIEFIDLKYNMSKITANYDFWAILDREKTFQTVSKPVGFLTKDHIRPLAELKLSLSRQSFRSSKRDFKVIKVINDSNQITT